MSGINSSTPSKPRQQVAIEVPIATLIGALELVRNGAYPSIDEAFTAGIEALRSQSARMHLPAVEPPEPATSSNMAWLFPPRPSPNVIFSKSVEPVNFTRVPHPLMPITVPRVFPMKIILRHLISQLVDRETDWIPLRDFRTGLSRIALRWGAGLKEIDLATNRPRGERVAASLPNDGRDVMKSMNRFVDAYAGITSADGSRVRGGLPFLGLTGISGTVGNEVVGVTAWGYEYAALSNPILDEGKREFPPLGRPESSFLIGCMKARCADEFSLVLYYCTLIGQSPNAGRDELSAKLKPFYVRYWNPMTLNDDMVESLRSTLHGRCQELGLVGTDWIGRSTRYRLTDAGREWIQNEVQVQKEMTRHE